MCGNRNIWHFGEDTGLLSWGLMHKSRALPWQVNSSWGLAGASAGYVYIYIYIYIYIYLSAYQGTYSDSVQQINNTLSINEVK